MPRQPLRIAVLLSGSGTSLENLLEQIESGALAASVCAVVSSKASRTIRKPSSRSESRTRPLNASDSSTAVRPGSTSTR